MNGFSQNMEKRIYTGQAYHSCTLEGLTSLLNSFNPEMPICCSTPDSSRLFGRECVVIFTLKNIEAEYDNQDADAGKNYGYDELRIIANILPVIEKVIVSDMLYEAYEADEEEEENGELLFELAEDFCIKYEKAAEKADFFNVN